MEIVKHHLWVGHGAVLCRSLVHQREVALEGCEEVDGEEEDQEETQHAPGVVVERVHGWEDLLCKHACEEVEEEDKEDGQWDPCAKVFGQPSETFDYQG